MYLGCSVSSWPHLLFFRLSSYPRSAIIVIWSHNKILKIFWLKWGKATSEKQFFILWQLGEHSLMCENHLVPQIVLRLPWREEENVFRKSHRRSWGCPFLQPHIFITDFPLGLSRTSTLNSEEPGTLICLFGHPGVGPPSIALIALRCTGGVTKASRRRKETQIHQFAPVRTEAE